MSHLESLNNTIKDKYNNITTNVNDNVKISATTNVNVTVKEYAIEGFVVESEVQRVALEIARKLDDERNLRFHLKAVHGLGTGWCSAIVKDLLSLPDDKIKKSRAAYYTYLVKLELKGRM